MKKLTVILCLSSFLVACGGGESESTAAVPAAVESLPSSVVPITIDSAGMASLVIDDRFDLSTKFKLKIDVDLSIGDVRAYLNICQKKANSLRADYGNCLVRAPLSQGSIKTTLAMSRQDIELIAEIWFYDTSTQPLSFAWQFDTQAEHQMFEIR